jgi:hypothetical protein
VNTDRQREFENMTEPSLADRLRAFELYLDTEPCQMDDACQIQSATQRMCPPCRLRMHFSQCLYNAEAYEGGPGEIPRRSS